MRYAVINDGFIVNVIIWDGQSDWTPPDGCVLMLESDAIAAGYTWQVSGEEL